MSPPPAVTICARCGATGPAVDGGCQRCGARADAAPVAPPSVARCPVCGTATSGRATCAGCGLRLTGPVVEAQLARGRWVPAPWQLAVGALALVVLTAAAVTLLDGDGPPGLSDRWAVSLDGAASGGVVVVGDVALVAEVGGTLVGIDARSGAPRWRFLAEQQVTAPVAAAGELALLATAGPDGSGFVFAVDLRTGQERWRVVTEAPVTAAPAADVDGVYLSQGAVTAHDPVTGSQRWRHDVDGGAGGLAVGGGVVVTAGGEGVVALSTTTGEERWGAGGGRPEVAPGIVGDLVVLGDGTGSVVARALDRGQERWRTGIGAQLLQPVVAGPDIAVVVTPEGIVGLDVADGARRWTAGPGGDQRLRASSDGTTVVAGSGSGVLLVDGFTGEVVASAGRGRSRDDDAEAPVLAFGVPVVVDDEVVVALTPGRG